MDQNSGEFEDTLVPRFWRDIRMKVKTDIAVHNDMAVPNKTKIKGKDLALDVDSPNEESSPVSNSQMKKNETLVCNDSEVENKMKIKEEVLGLDEEHFHSSDTITIKNNNDIYGMFAKVEIKGEPWWDESAIELESPSISELQVYSEIKDGVNEDFSATESARLYTDTLPSTCDTTPYLYITADLEEKDSLKCVKENPLLAEANIHEVDISDMVETSLEENADLCHKSTPRDHEQSDKFAICSNSNNKDLKAHILTPEGKKPFKCYICENRFTQKGHLNSHILIHLGKRPYHCDVCKKSFTRKEHLISHNLIHQGKRPFKCDVCENSFTQKGALKRHALIHQEKRPYQCDACEKSFTRKEHFIAHKLIHQGKKPFKCDVCENSFTQKGALKRHLLIHQGKRPYQCDLCDKTFTRKGHLNAHILNHQDKPPFKCDV